MAKRISSTSVNWTLIAEFLIKEDKPAFAILRSKSDKFLRLAIAEAPELPKINWDSYKKKISKPGFIEIFQKGYEGLKIPYPSDQGLLAKRDQDEAESLKIVDKQLAETERLLEQSKAHLAKLESVKKYSEMSIEEFILARPEYSVGPENPRLFPQFIDTTPEYDDKNPPPPIPGH